VTYVVLATGDLAMDRDAPDDCFAATREALHAADLVFGQLETSFAEKGSRLPQARHAVLCQPEGAAAVGRAGFDVISFAGNHCLDWGQEALAETIDRLEQADVRVIGVGRNIAEARRPAIFTLPDGTRIAFLAYSSILPQSYWADERRGGCAPMRAFTVYEQVEPDQPGTPPHIDSFPHPDDLAAMEKDICAAKAQADVVIVSHHWGIHFVRATIAGYQRDVARATIAAGADAILGHHAHILKGAELIDGKPVFYSLCNFATDLRMDPAHAASKSFQEIRVLTEEWEPDFESLYNFPKAAALSMIARLEIAEGRIVRSGLLPLYIGRDAVPRILERGDARHAEVVDYLVAVTGEAGLNARFRAEDDMVVIEQAA
jgi:poly-gamma-glutamate capsule biosynthesis protein CapA/YwtB (metallophosphatase superfamily)